MKQFIKMVENNQHLLFDEMLQASTLMFQDETALHEIQAFLIALAKKARLLMK